MIKKRITSFIAAIAIAATAIPTCSLIPAYTHNSAIVYAEENYSIPDLQIENKKIPDKESFRFANSMGAGFNLGNTFDAINNTMENDVISIDIPTGLNPDTGNPHPP